MALMEAVAAQAHAALVVTTTQVTDAFGDQTAQVLAAISKAQSLIARKEHVLRPSEEADLPRILARRLFASVDVGAAATVAADYATAASEAFAPGADLPERKTGPAFAGDLARTFPFHPGLITVLDKRLSTIPNFQRTRGALRLLARTVRRTWQQRPPGKQLLHLHHVDLADKDTAEDLSSRLDKATLEPVIRADIASQRGACRTVYDSMHRPLSVRLRPQLNVGRLRAPMDDPLVEDFREHLDLVNALAESSPGFVWRLQDDSGNATGIKPFGDDLEIVNLTVWESIEALADFTYRSGHARFLRRRREFFEVPTEPILCLWWIPEGTVPTVDEALARLQHLRTHGPTPTAFTFRHRFDAGADEVRPGDRRDVCPV